MKKTVLTALLALSPLAAAVDAGGTRLAVADARTHAVTVIDLDTGKPLGAFSTPGPVSGLYATGSGAHAFALHRGDHRVTVVHSGLSLVDHGDHADLVEKAPHVLTTLNVGQQPTHFFAHGEDIAIFNDKDGSVAVLNEKLLGLSLDYRLVKVGPPDHGAPVVVNGWLLSGSLNRARVEAFNLRTGKPSGTVEGCPGLHGEALKGNTAYFGCTDGVLAIDVSPAGRLVSRKIANPVGTPEKVRVGTLVAHDLASVQYGNLGQGLAIVRPGAPVLEAVPLPANPVKFAFSRDGSALIVLTNDGKLHRLESGTGKVLATVAVTGAVKPSTEQNPAPRPSFAVGRDAVYVTDPEKGEVIEVALAGFRIERRFALGGAPTHAAFLSLPGARH